MFSQQKQDITSLHLLWGGNASRRAAMQDCENETSLTQVNGR